MTPEQPDRENDNKDFSYNVLLTNARSLSPKIESLHTFFEEHRLDVAMITESWLKDGSTLDRDVIDLEHGTNLKIIYKNRPKRAASARAVGGGVSIVFDKARCNLRERRIVGNKFELVLATGKIAKVIRPFAFICIYIEPRMKVDELEKLNDLLAAEIVKLKAAADFLLFVGGDLNRKSIEPAIRNFPDISQINNQPTRGNACLDVLYSNSSSASPSNWPPLETRDGIRSDHDCVLVACSEPRSRNFVWVNKTVRKQTDKACRAFGADLRRVRWDVALPDTAPPATLVENFERILKDLTDRHFPLVKIRCRSNEPPWITNGIRRLARLKRRVYKRENKSRLWKTLDSRTQELIAASKEKYVDNATAAGPKAFYSAVKNLAGDGKQANWDVMDLFPGRSALEAGDEVATFFTKISDEFQPLQDSRAGPTETRAPLTLGQVRQALKAAKKPNSAVEGDVLPRLMKMYHHDFGVPAMKIFNAVLANNAWPARWKTETTVIIPKVPNPASLSDCRNISCTPFLSKVLEMIVLEDLRREIAPDPVQYGGVKKSSVDHLLVDLFESVLAPLEDGLPSVLVGLDFEKAFNRLNHHVCLEELRKLGASSTSLNLVRSFLANRTMRVKIHGQLSASKLLRGGSPQGSILGCFLYCAATQQLNGDTPPRPPAPTTEEPPRVPGHAAPSPASSSSSDGPTMDLVEAFAPGLGSPETDAHATNDQHSPIQREQAPTPSAPVLGVGMVKYVDDTTIIETCDAGMAVRHIQAGGPTESVPAPLTEGLLGGWVERIDNIGMRLNCKKTQVLCISPDNGYETSTKIRIDDTVIEAQPTMKLLGFVLGSRPGVHDQVESIRERFRRKFWALIHLRRAGLKGTRLFRLYAALVRPVIEANCVIYHPMLTGGQTIDLERLQKLVLRLCFGTDRHYVELLEEFNIESLAQRRSQAVVKFARKAMKNDRFAPRWFKPRQEVGTDLRRRRPFIENRARTKRYQTSPLIALQRAANDIMTAGTN